MLKFLETKVDVLRILGLDGESGGRWLSPLKLKDEVGVKVSPAAGSVEDRNDLRLDLRADEGGRATVHWSDRH